MAVRNFWVDVEIDGRKTRLEGGPRSRFGGFEAEINQREDGLVTTPIKIKGIELNGELITRVYVNGDLIAEHRTNR